MRYKLTFLKGPKTVAVVVGFLEHNDEEGLGVAIDAIAIEQKIEALLGFRVHVETTNEQETK